MNRAASQRVSAQLAAIRDVLLATEETLTFNQILAQVAGHGVSKSDLENRLTRLRADPRIEYLGRSIVGGIYTSLYRQRRRYKPAADTVARWGGWSA